MSIFEFFSRDAGQRRRQFLTELIDDNVEQIIPPNLRALAGFVSEANPIAGMGNAMQSSRVVFDPEQTMEARRKAAVDMGMEMALSLSPAVLARMGYLTPVAGAMESLLGGSPTTEAIKEKAGETVADATGIARSIAAGDAEMLGEVFQRGGEPQDLSAARTQFGGLLNPLIDDEVKRVNKIDLDPAMLSEQKLPTYVEKIPFTTVKAPEEMMPVVERDISEFKGSILTPAYGDRTYGGKILTHIGGVELTKPVEMQGGHDFMRYLNTGLWASEKGAMEKKANFYDRLIQEGADPLMIYTAMGGQSADFSHHMSDAMMGLIEQSPITKKAAKKFDDFVKNVGNKYDKKITPGDKNWPGILSPDARRYLLENMTGTNRRLLWQEMDKKSYLEDGFPFVGAVRAAITDPALQRSKYFTSGQSIGRARGGGLLDMDDAKYGNYGGVMPHKSYDSQIEGDYLGKLIENVPAELIFRDFFNARRNAGIATSGDQRSFMMSPYIAQRVDNQMIDEVSRYIENLRRGY